MGSVIGNSRGFSYGQKTAAANTVFLRLIPPSNRNSRLKTRITRMVYTSGSTLHTITCMRSLARTTAASALAAGGTALVLTRDPGLFAANYVLDGIVNAGAQVVPGLADNPIATNDWVAVQSADGTWTFSLVTISGLTATLTTAVTGNVLAGAMVHWFGITTDKHPETNEAHPQIIPTISTMTTYGNGDGAPIFETQKPGDCLLLHSSNGTAQGYLESVGGIYTP